MVIITTLVVLPSRLKFKTLSLYEPGNQVLQAFVQVNGHKKGSAYISNVPKNWTKYFLGSGTRPQSSGLLTWIFFSMKHSKQLHDVKQKVKKNISITINQPTLLNQGTS